MIINNEIRKALGLNLIQYSVMEYLSVKAGPTGFNKTIGTIAGALDITSNREGITLQQLADKGLISLQHIDDNILVLPTAKWKNMFKPVENIVSSSNDYKKDQPLECYFDGACEPVNPGGNMGMGWIIVNTRTGHVRNRKRYKAERSTNSNNVAEYLSLYMLLKDLRDYSDCNITIYGDSKLVVNQLNGEWELGSGLHYNIAKRTKDLLSNVLRSNSIEIRWIPRERNTGADNLSKEALRTLYSETKVKNGKFVKR